MAASLCLSGATQRKILFQVPAGEAQATLKAYASQAVGERLLYSLEEVRGAKTREVSGELTAREALERMLEGSGLTVTADEKTGALSVHRQVSTKTSASGNRGTFESLAATNATAPMKPTVSGSGLVRGRVQNVATGQYLNNARIAVRGTDIIAFTDQNGEFVLAGLQAGGVVLDVFYTGLDSQQLDVLVKPDQPVELDVRLTSAKRYGKEGDVIEMTTFVVTSERETEGEALATNEQRFAPNIKNVVATDALGEIMGNSVGEFLKFLPGLTADYTDAEITGISVRGIGGDMTKFSSDGAPMASASTSSTRSFQLLNIALNNISRIEVTKVPTPSTPADSLAGSVNMVSKSSFERAKAQLRYGVNVSGSHEDLTVSKTPHSFEKYTNKILPGLDFDYTLPINKNLGLVVAGMHSNRFNEQHIATTAYNFTATNTGATYAKPFLQQFTLNDGPRNSMRNSGSIRIDWRPAPNSVLSFAGQATQYTNYIGTYGWVIDTGTAATPTVAGRPTLTFGNDYTIGATGRGAVNMNGTFQTLHGLTQSAGLTYRFDNGRWRIDAGLNRTESERRRDNENHGHFMGMSVSMLNPVRVTFRDNVADRPGKIEVFDNNNGAVDIYDLANYRLSTVSDMPYHNLASVTSAHLNVRRGVDWFRFPAALQTGVRFIEETRDTRLQSIAWTYNGLDGKASTIETPVPYAAQIYADQDAHYGFSSIPWVSPHLMHRAWRENPGLFSQTPAQLVSQESYRITNSEYIKESVSAAYLQFEARFLNNRLGLLTGARFEKTTDEGDGPLYDPNAVYLRDADGEFQRDAAGRRIRNPAAGAVGSMEELQMLRKERAFHARRSYDGLYPSLHATYSITENLLLRGAYAGTYGRPNFSNIIPNATIYEADLTEDELNDPSTIRGTITMRNTGLRPWSADNYDLSLEYYTPQGGVLSGGVFLKRIRDFFADDVRIATEADLAELGLDPRYVGWQVSTKFNAGDAEIAGVEFSVRQSLRALGGWMRYFTVFVNGTKLNLKGHNQADFSSFIKESANWGFTLTKNRFTLMAKWNYRGLDKRGAIPSYGPDAFSYFAGRTILDLNASFQFTPRLGVTASIGNVFNTPQRMMRYGSETPDYARQFRTSEYGVSFALGLRGTF